MKDEITEQDLEILMNMISKYATFIVREHDDGLEQAAQFFERVAKACTDKAAEYRGKS
jgi:hypothetical protein